MHFGQVIKLFDNVKNRDLLLELFLCYDKKTILYYNFGELEILDDLGNKFIFRINNSFYSIEYFSTSYGNPVIYYDTIEPVKQVTKTITVWETDEERF